MISPSAGGVTKMFWKAQRVRDDGWKLVGKPVNGSEWKIGCCSTMLRLTTSTKQKV